MHWFRGRIGLIIPSSNTTMEPEFWLLFSSNGVSIHSARLHLENVDAASLRRMARRAAEAAELLATADVDVIVYGCTTGSLVGGIGFDEKITETVRKASGRPAIATATAVINALKQLKAYRVAIATPYIDELNRLEKEFLEGHGFEVVDVKGLGILDNREIGRLPAWRVYRLARSVNTSRADALFLSCTNMPTLSIIDALERDLGIPVISSNTASAWAAARLMGIKPSFTTGGMLLRELP